MKCQGRNSGRFNFFLIGQVNSPVNLPTMTNCQNQDNHVFVLDVTQHPIVSNPVSPEAGVITLQRFSKMPGIFASLYPVVEPVEKTCLNRPIQFSQLPFGNIADFNCPSQALLSIVSAACVHAFVIGLVWPVPSPHCHLSIAGSLPVPLHCGYCRGFWRADPNPALFLCLIGSQTWGTSLFVIQCITPLIECQYGN